MRGVPRAANAWQSESAAAPLVGPRACGKRIVIARLVRPEDFERVLSTRSCARSTHFAVHHLPGRPSAPARHRAKLVSDKLSTTEAPDAALPVDDLSARAAAALPPTLWFGMVVPKRHARRAVTRSLLKRQIRAAANGHAAALAAGLWVVRLRAPFERGSFASAASAPLKRAARTELEHLLRAAADPAVAH